MRERLSGIVAGAAVVLVTGYVLWPPGDLLWQWWTVLPESLQGDLAVLALLSVPCVAVGLATIASGRVRPSELLVGGVLAYVLAMGAMSVAISSDSPVYLVLYGFILVAVLFGAGVGTAAGVGRADRARPA